MLFIAYGLFAGKDDAHAVATAFFALVVLEILLEVWDVSRRFGGVVTRSSVFIPLLIPDESPSKGLGSNP
jgi:hypothetical protein